jgi:hypothetical protein
MKKTKLVFYVVMSMILMGAGAANAAQIASKEYVDTGLATKPDKTEFNTFVTDLGNNLGKLAGNDTVATVDIDDAAVTKPKLSVDVQTTLDKADTALQSADLTDYAKTTDVNTALGTKADQATTYTKTEVDTALTTKANTADVNTALSTKADTTYVDTGLATKANTTDVNTALAAKADQATTYTKTEVDTALTGKADTSTTYTKTEVDTALTGKANTTDLAAKEDVANKSNDINADTGSTTKYPTVSAVENRIYEVEDAIDVTFEKLENKSTDISADTGSTKKYPTVSAVETYSIPKPSATCLGAQSQCVLSINKTNGSIYWEDVAMLPEEPIVQ